MKTWYSALPKVTEFPGATNPALVNFAMLLISQHMFVTEFNTKSTGMASQ